MKQQRRKACAVLLCMAIVTVIVSLPLAILSLPPKIMPIRSLAVVTGSMEPAIPVGSLVIIAPAAYDEIQPGDVITYLRNDDKLITHRVVKKITGGQLLITKGDANKIADVPVRYSAVVGVVRWHIGKAGYALIWLNPLNHKIIAATVFVTIWAIALILFYGFGADSPKNARSNTTNRKRNKEELNS